MASDLDPVSVSVVSNQCSTAFGNAKVSLPPSVVSCWCRIIDQKEDQNSNLFGLNVLPQ